MRGRKREETRGTEEDSEKLGVRGRYRPYLYPCMVPIKREPLTAFVSDTVAVLEHARVGVAAERGASGCYRPSGFISVPEGDGDRR